MRDNSGSSSESSDSGAIIGGAVGGVILLLMIIAVLCIVILCMRRSCRKESLGAIPFDGKLSNDTTQSDGSLTHTTVNQRHGTKTNHSRHSATAEPTEYGVIDQPQSDAPNYDTDNQTDEVEYGVVNQPRS